MTHFDIDRYAQIKKDVGKRFKTFRYLICKHIDVLAEESLIPGNFFQCIEIGAILPDILFCEYFYRVYGLNLTWLLKGEGDIFYQESTGTPHYIYEFCRDNLFESEAFTVLLKELASNFQGERVLAAFAEDIAEPGCLQPKVRHTQSIQIDRCEG